MNAERIFGQSVHSGIFFVLNFASRLLLAIAIGKSLSPQDYGGYSLIGAVAGMTTTIFPFGAHYYVREVPGRPPLQGAGVFKSVAGIHTLVLICILGMAFAIPSARAPVARLIGIEKYGGLVLLVGVLLLAESLSSDFVRFLFASKEIKRGNVVEFLRSGFWGYVAFGVFLLLPTGLNLSLLLALWCFSVGLAVLYGGWRSDASRLWHAQFKPKVYPAALLFGFPLLFTFSLDIVNWLGRFILVGYYSMGVMGVFAYHYNIILMIAAVSAPLIGTPIEPYVIEAYNTGQTRRSGYLLGAALRYRVGLVAPLLVVATIWDKALIRLLARADYTQADGLLALLAPVPVLMILNSTFERAIFLERRTMVIGRCYLIAAGIQLFLYLVLVPWEPFYGAAIATDSGLAVLTFLLWYCSRRGEVPIDVALGRIGLAVIPCLGVAWIFAQTVPHLHPFPLLVLATAIVGASYFLFTHLFRVLSASEEQMLRDMMRRGGKRLRFLLWT